MVEVELLNVIAVADYLQLLVFVGSEVEHYDVSQVDGQCANREGLLYDGLPKTNFESSLPEINI